MFERFAHAARVAVEDAQFEAERRGDRRIGSDHLLLALLRDDEIAGAVGVDGATAHEALERLDRAALAAVGFAVDAPRPTPHAVPGRRVRSMTAGTKGVLRDSLVAATTERARTITPRHLLLALLERREPDPAATLLAALPVDRQALRARLAPGGPR